MQVSGAEVQECRDALMRVFRKSSLYSIIKSKGALLIVREVAGIHYHYGNVRYLLLMECIH